MSSWIGETEQTVLCYFFLSYTVMRIAYWCTEAYCVTVLGETQRTEKKSRETKFRHYWRSKFEPRRLSVQDASLRQYIGAGITLMHFAFNPSVSILSAISVSNSKSPTLSSPPAQPSAVPSILCPCPFVLCSMSLSFYMFNDGLWVRVDD